MTPEREALEAARKDIEDHCRIVGRQYNRATKKYEWNDELWRQSDPGSFAVVQKIDMALATLSAAPGEPCAVKPLEWRDHRPDSFPEPAWSAQTPFGFYNIEEVSASDSPAYVVRLHAHHFVADKDGLDEAKAAAQADYEQRIRSALVTAPQSAAGWDEHSRTFDTRGSTLTRVGRVLTITCETDETANRIADELRREAPAPADLSYVSQLIAENNELKDQLAARPDTAEARLREGDTIQTLLDLLNPLHGEIDRQTYDERVEENFDAPADAEYGVNITARMERDLTQAVLILEDRKRQALSPPSGGDAATESEGGVEGHAAEKRRSSTPEPEQARDEINEEGAAGIKPGPSEPSPPADRREIVAWFKDRIDKYATQLNATGQADVAHLLRRDAQIILAALDGGR